LRYLARSKKVNLFIFNFNVNKFILKFIVFATALLFTWIVGVALLGQLNVKSITVKNIIYNTKPSSDYAQTRIIDLESTADIDVLVLGSSHAYRGFDPRIFERNGLRLFNLGSSSQTPIQNLYLAEFYAEQLRPRIAIIEVFPLTMGMDGLESALNLIPKSQLSWSLVKMVAKVNHLKAWNTLIVHAANELLFNNPRLKPQQRAFEDHLYVKGGYVQHTSLAFNPKLLDQQQTFGSNAFQKTALEALIMLLHERGCEVVLVQAPVTSAYYNQFENARKWDEYFVQLPNSSYYNFNGQDAFTDGLHFYDSHHLNQGGVEVFNALLFTEIDELKDLN